MLSEQQISELRRLEKAATKGEWMLGRFGGVYPVEPGYGIIARSGSKHGSGKLDVENEKLIVALRNAAPALLSAHADAVRLSEAAEAVVAAWDDDEIGQIDGELIDALRPAEQGGV